MSKAEITAHLKMFDPVQRKVLQEIRETIAAALPEATETIKYGIPTFVIEGKGVIGFDGYKAHNSIFPYSGSISTRLKAELVGYTTTKGSIHFDRDKAMPKTLLRKIIKERLREMDEKRK